MADIKGFRGILYNLRKIKDLSKVVTPPYDVISKEEQSEFYKRSPYNIIRILLGKDFKSDDGLNNKYIRAKRYFLEWISKRILIQDKAPSIYIYQQGFKYKNIKRARLGFIALLKLEDFNSKNIFPHEKTMDGPKEDRLRLLKNVHANLSPIFVLFSDKNKKISHIISENMSKTQPIIDIYDRENTRHSLWRIAEPYQINRIKTIMQDKEIFIADGHHRYEVALEFSREMKEERFGFIMSYFTPLEDKGLVILPVHRIVKGLLRDRVLEFLKKEIQTKFLLKNLKDRDGLFNFLEEDRKGHRFGVYLGRAGFWGLNSLKAFDEKTLDVDILHKFIIVPLVKKLSKKAQNVDIEFTKDIYSAIKIAEKDSQGVAFFLVPTRISQVRDIARFGKRLPQKATCFYPKPLSGLVINRF